MKRFRQIYRILRSILFSAILLVGALYLLLYIVLSVPAVQTSIKERAEDELSDFLGSRLKIGSLSIMPFNELKLSDITLYTPEDEKCASVETVGAGINLFKLMAKGEIEITYAEIISLDALITQGKEGGSLNINFLIDAFKPKDKNKPPAKFDLKLRNIVIRKSAMQFHRLWKKGKEDESFDPAHIVLSDIMADIYIPRLKNDMYMIDLRRLAFRESSGADITKLSFKAQITPTSGCISDLILNVGDSYIRTSDVKLSYPSFNKLTATLEEGNHRFSITGEDLHPSDFAFLYPGLSGINGTYSLDTEMSGNLQDIILDHLALISSDKDFSFNMAGRADNMLYPEDRRFNISRCELYCADELKKNIIDNFNLDLPEKAKDIIRLVGNIMLDIEGDADFRNRKIHPKGTLAIKQGKIEFDAVLGMNDRRVSKISGNIASESFDLGELLGNAKIKRIGLDLDADIFLEDKIPNGKVNGEIGFAELDNITLTNIHAQGEKQDKEISFTLDVDDTVLKLAADLDAHIDGAQSHFTGNASIRNFSPSLVSNAGALAGYELDAQVNADIEGNSPENIIGFIDIDGVSLRNAEGDVLNLDNFSADIFNIESGRVVKITGDYLTADIKGNYNIGEIGNQIIGVMYSILPALSSEQITHKCINAKECYAEFTATVRPCDRIVDFFNLPIRPLENIDISGAFDMSSGNLECDLKAPYLLQGSNKLISSVSLHGNAQRGRDATVRLAATYPVKYDRANIEVLFRATDNKIYSDISWDMANNRQTIGEISIDALLHRNPFTRSADVNLQINPSTFRIGDTEWNIDPATAFYSAEKVNVNGLRIRHDGQFLTIDGTAAADPESTIELRLADIDLSYIFDTLNINYVKFGGIATGELTASSLFSKTPEARTRHLHVADFSYNDAVLGDAELQSHWDPEQKMVRIRADIKDGNIGGGIVDGGIFIGKDSLSFDMDVHKVNIGLLKPFVATFTSDIGGRASGKLKLFGTFKDIDLIGDAYADSLFIKVDYTNVYYHGSDSVRLASGVLEIPNFKAYDKYGNSAVLSGEMKHDHFRDPEFEFRVNNANRLLCFDTNRNINPDWFGRIFASGNATLRGRPGLVSLMVDVTTEPNSDFTFVLSETQTAADYTFLTFSDHTKCVVTEEEMKETYEERYAKKMNTITQTASSVFVMDLRTTVDKSALLTIVMDPKSGDKITAHGSGPMQISYDTENDELSMYGKYTLIEGNYNFSLQDLILRDFKIKSGSSISFNGDPMRAYLDITAAYRVNTNLSDLDKSFSTDRDLNRTNVPVDALLNVAGDLQTPEITFDINLPTLTSDVERKVKSIISTDDMMNRQIIYLLALNRFYTPEYMGAASNGTGELASVASSTISSQLSSFMGQLTDKVSVAPSFRSDKGDFSDTEVDLSLSSRLLNNRLFINGNFGYRDRSTSQTTFVGDFDIEYLLSHNGDLRLKAYNHFNDQYYYLKSALTTQGIGIVYRKDFNNPFTFLRRRKRKMTSEDKIMNDSINHLNRN